MRVIRFPSGDEGYERGAEIDAALNGELAGPEALVLRELCEDVRVMVPGPAPDFERELQARVAEWARERREPLRSRLRNAPRSIPPRAWTAGGAAAGALVALVALLVTIGPLRSGSAPPTSRVAEGVVATSKQHSSRPAYGGSEAAESSPPSSPASAARLQQLGASVTLATGSEGVQDAADAVSRLGTSYGGYVASSHVQVRHGGTSEAQLLLSLPSAKLSQAIAALGRIAPERAVNQESQDITSSYAAARRRLSDDEAVRRALLRALAAATTQGQIESLRDRLASNRSALANDREALHVVSRRAATAQLEVTITSAAAPHGLTLGRGLHDAGDVLAAVGAAVLIALAVLVPLGLLALAAIAVSRAWRRHRREAALEP